MFKPPLGHAWSCRFPTISEVRVKTEDGPWVTVEYRRYRCSGTGSLWLDGIGLCEEHFIISMRDLLKHWEMLGLLGA